MHIIKVGQYITSICKILQRQVDRVDKQESRHNGGTSLEMISSCVTSKEVEAMELSYRLRRDDKRHRSLHAWQCNSRVTIVIKGIDETNRVGVYA